MIRLGMAVALGCVVATSAAAQTSTGVTFQDLLPRHVGNTWTYEVSGGGVSGTQTSMEVIRHSGGWAYFEGLPGSGDRWVWGSAVSANAWVWNAQIGNYAHWLNLGVGVGNSFTVSQNAGLGCWDSAVYSVQSESEVVVTPVGTFSDCVVLSLERQNCVDAGVTRMVFAPGVGIVEYTTQSIAGPRDHTLHYAEVDGTIYTETEPTAALTVAASVDQLKYRVLNDTIPEMTATLALTNGGNEPVDFMYSSGQHFEITLLDAQGTQVYRWGEGRAFILVALPGRLEPGESLKLGTTFTLEGADREALPPGDYSMVIEHLGRGLYATGSVPFAIVDP